MIIVDLIYNLSVLVALSLLSGFIDVRYDRKESTGQIFQGVLFGSVAIIGMLHPFHFAEGIIFDGRSIVISLCTLFFGPLAGAVSSIISIIFRISLGGGGALTGVFVIIASYLIGWYYYYLRSKNKLFLTKTNLYIFGLIVSVVMITLMLTLPANSMLSVYKTVPLTVLVFYPIITLMIGKIFLDHEENKNSLEKIKQDESLFRTTLYSIGDAVITTDKFGRIRQMNPVAENLTGWTEAESKGKPLDEIFNIINEDSRLPVDNPAAKVLREGNTIGLANHTLLVSKNGNEIPIADSGAPIRDEFGKVEGVVLVFRDKSEERASENRLYQSEDRLKRAELASKSGNWEFHIDKETAIVSEGARKIYGIKNELCRISELKKIPLPEYREVLDSAMTDMIENNKQYDVEFKIKNAESGEIIDIHSIAEYNDKSKVLFGIIQNVTERKKLEQERFQLLSILDNSLNEIYIFDSSTLKFEYANQGALNNIGYTLNEIETLTPIDLKPGFTTESFKLALEPLTTGRENKLVLDTIHKRKDETFYPVEVHIQLHKLENKSVYFAIITDTTLRKKTEEALRKSEEKFRNIFEDHPAIKLLIDPETGDIIDANNAAEQYYGWNKKELKKMKIHQINVLPETETKMELSKAVNTDCNLFEFRHRRSDGSIRDVEVFSGKIEIAGKIYLHSVIHDITEKKSAEKLLMQNHLQLEKLVKQRTDELNESNKKLLLEIDKKKQYEIILQQSLEKEKELSEMKSRFISTTSHEFRTPLTSVLSSVELLERYGRKWSDEKYNYHIGKIKNSVDYLTKLLDDVLTVSRSESNQMVFNPIALNLRSLCMDIIEDLASYKGENHLINFEFSAERQEYQLDPKLIRSIVINLLSNAIKYSPEGGLIDFNISEQQEKLIICVADKGIGIPPEEIPGLFEPFNRAKNAKDIPGTGLGLSIVKRSVTLHSGEIKVESEIGEGTKFLVILPIK